MRLFQCGVVLMKSSMYVVVALIAGIAGFAIYRLALAPAPEAVIETAATGLDSSPAEVATPAGSPDVLPEFSLIDIEGTPRSIRSWPGKAMIVNFWATWCAPCRREIPLLKEIQQQRGPDGFQVVGVAVDVREEVLSYAKEIDIDYPVIMGEQEGLNAVTLFGLGSIGFPFTVFTDNQHRIVLTHLGELHKNQAEAVLAVVERVNSGELTPAAARSMAVAQLQALDETGA